MSKDKIDPAFYRELYEPAFDILITKCDKYFENSIDGLDKKIMFLEYCAEKLKAEYNNDLNEPAILLGEINFRKECKRLMLEQGLEISNFNQFEVSFCATNLLEIQSDAVIKISEERFKGEPLLQYLFILKWTNFFKALGEEMIGNKQIIVLNAELSILKKLCNIKPMIKWEESIEELTEMLREEAHKHKISENQIFREAEKKYLINKNGVIKHINFQQLKNARDRINERMKNFKKTKK